MKKNIIYAHKKMQRISARKARLVADLFRGKTVAQAVDILRNTRKKASLLFIELLNSAIANAVNNNGLEASKLVVSEVLVNEGPTLKRFQPHSRGTAKPILKRTSHLTIGVSVPVTEQSTNTKVVEAKEKSVKKEVVKPTIEAKKEKPSKPTKEVKKEEKPSKPKATVTKKSTTNKETKPKKEPKAKGTK